MDALDVLLIQTRPVGGAAHQAALLKRSLISQSHHVTLVSGVDTHGEGSVGAGDIDITIDALRRPVSPLADVAAYRALRGAIAERRPSVVHTHQAKAGALGRLAASRAGVRAVVHTYHGYAVDELFPKRAASAFLAAERRLARRTGALIAPSTSLRDELLARGVGRSDQWHVVPYGIDLGAAGVRSRVDARRSLGLPADDVLVGIVGRLAPVKDHAAFLDAAAALSARHGEVSFVIAGDGELRAALDSRARSTLPGRVHFLGHVDEINDVYAAIDVLAVTSRSEGTPVSVIEAAAFAVPAVAMTVGGVAAVIEDGVTGVLVPSRDVGAFVDGLARVVGDPQLRASLGEQARATVPGRFDAAASAAATVEVYRSLG